MRAPDWLTARPVAHRGLHDLSRGIVENTPSAIRAAVEHGFSIEIDVQRTADGEAIVHHDGALGRLTEGREALASLTADRLKQVAFKQTADRMVTLGELCDLIAGRSVLVVEIKSLFDGDVTLVKRVAEVLAAYQGPAVAMSFDPEQVAALRHIAPNIVRGIVAQRRYDDGHWAEASSAQRRRMTTLRHALETQPHFVAYSVNDLPAPAPWIARHLFGCPLLTWTVRTPEQRSRAARYADQMIFEGFVPKS
ncbi:MAG: glycerophosphodiester phosphodiesterase family protein [Xanthobacteraceae bacterium]